MDDQAFQRELTSYTHEQDLYKHIATLSTGSLVLLVTFLEKLFTHPVARQWLAAALIAFVSSISGSIIMQAASVLTVDSEDDPRLTHVRVPAFILVVIVTFGGFFAGILSLLTFALSNL